jgi:hypothetical protein
MYMKEIHPRRRVPYAKPLLPNSTSRKKDLPGPMNIR